MDGHGGEAVLMDGQVVSSTSSVAFGHTMGKVLAFAYIKLRAVSPGQNLEVVVMGTPRKAIFLGEPAFDPRSERPKTDG
jgi:dimethylglycine dehydrogenase